MQTQTNATYQPFCTHSCESIGDLSSPAFDQCIAQCRTSTDSYYRVVLDLAGDEHYGSYDIVDESPNREDALDVFQALQGPGNSDIDWPRYRSIRVLEYFQDAPFLIAQHEIRN